MTRFPMTAALLWAALPLVASAQSLTDLPAGAGGFGGISSDGKWVVGRDNVSGGAYIWSQVGGLIPLGEDDALAVSTDGSRVYGDTTNGNGNGEAAIFNGGAWTPLGTFAGGSSCSGTLTSPYDMSDDGMAATGLAWESCGGRAFYWDGSTMIKLPQLGPNSARGNAVSGDGNWVGGWDEAPNGTRRAAIWDIVNGTEVLPLVTPSDPTGGGETWALSTDGRYAVGQASEPWIYDTLTGELEFLGTLPGASPSDFGIARAVSDDGNTVVGLSGNSFFGTPWRAWIWTRAGGIEELDNYLGNAGVPVVFSMYGAVDMSADGRTILGAYANFIGFPGDGWVADLPDIDSLKGGTTGANGLSPTLGATGTITPGSPISLYLADGAPSAFSVLFVSVGTGAGVPLLGGTFWAAPVAAQIQPLPTDGSGDWELTTVWPGGLPADICIRLQVLVQDAGATGGYALSNGLKITGP